MLAQACYLGDSTFTGDEAYAELIDNPGSSKAHCAPISYIERVMLFGSYADGNATAESDVDVLVEFGARPITLLHYCGFREKLAEALRLPVDVVKYPLSEEMHSYFEIHKMVPLYER